MPKLNEVIEMLATFGMPEEYVRQALAMGESAFNAFESLKLTVQLQYEEMSPEKQAEVQETYDRLMKISMKSRKMGSDHAVEKALEGMTEAADLMRDVVEEIKPWAFVLKDMLEYEGTLTFSEQINKFCVRRGVNYPPPSIERALLTTAFKYKAKGAPCPKGFA